MNQQRYLAALGNAVHEHRRFLVRLARREGLSAEDALDVVQQAFEAVLESPEPEALLASSGDARRWLGAHTRNLARNRRRLHAVSRPHVSDEATLEALEAESDPEAAVSDVDELLRLASCLRTLSATQREVVRLRLLEEREGEDVARQLQMSRGHIAVLLHRARGNLRVCMGIAPRV